MYNPEWGDEQYWWPKLVFHPMVSKKDGAIVSTAVRIDDSKLVAYSVYHGFGKVDALGFRLETPEGTFAYSGDTGVCEELSALAYEADIFVCEASARVGDYKASVEYGHLTPRFAGEIAKKSDVKKLVLFHHTGLDSDEAMLEDCRLSGYKGELVIPKDFQIFEV
ncbi:MAG: MBL fold metallo-hydrolase [Candidatus Spechtbacterales bacterium]